MSERIVGQVERVNGPVIQVSGVKDAKMLELVHVGEARIVGEIIKLETGKAIAQVYEDTTGLTPGENIYGSGMPLSVDLGPGLIGTIYDGIQRPLEKLLELSAEQYIERGISLSPLDREKKWHFVPADLIKGDEIAPGSVLGSVQETDRIVHKILVPPDRGGVLKSLVHEGDYTVETPIALLETPDGEIPLCMVQRWPLRIPRPTIERNIIDIPLITGQRVIDTLFPVAKGGTVAIPGGFGTGKTMIQHAIAMWCDASIIVYIGCGERGNEMTDVLTEFPKLLTREQDEA